ESLFFLGELDSGSVVVKQGELRVRPWLERLVQRIDHSSDGGPTIRLSCPDEVSLHTHPESLARLLAVLIYEGTEDEDSKIDVGVAASDGAVVFTIEHPRSCFDEPVDDLAEHDVVAVTELAREVVARASEVLRATVTREPAPDDR